MISVVAILILVMIIYVLTTQIGIMAYQCATYLVKWLAVATIAGRYISPKPTPVMMLEPVSVIASYSMYKNL